MIADSAQLTFEYLLRKLVVELTWTTRMLSKTSTIMIQPLLNFRIHPVFFGNISTIFHEQLLGERIQNLSTSHHQPFLFSCQTKVQKSTDELHINVFVMICAV